MNWAFDQWSKSAAMIGLYLKQKKNSDVYDFLSELLQHGMERLKPADYAMLEAAGVQI